MTLVGDSCFFQCSLLKIARVDRLRWVALNQLDMVPLQRGSCRSYNQDCNVKNHICDTVMPCDQQEIPKPNRKRRPVWKGGRISFPDVKWKCAQGYFFETLQKSSLFWWGQSHGHLSSSTFSEVKKEPAPPSRRAEKRVPHESILVWKDWGGIGSGGWKGRSVASFCWVNIIISALSTSLLSSSYFGQCEKWWKSPKIGFSSLGSMVSGVMKF